MSALSHISLLSRCQLGFRSPFLYFGASIGVNFCNRCMRIRCAHAPIHTARKGLQGHSGRTPPNGKAHKEAKSYSSRHYLLAIYGLNYFQPITSWPHYQQCRLRNKGTNWAHLHHGIPLCAIQYLPGQQLSSYQLHFVSQRSNACRRQQINTARFRPVKGRGNANMR